MEAFTVVTTASGHSKHRKCSESVKQAYQITSETTLHGTIFFF